MSTVEKSEDILVIDQCDSSIAINVPTYYYTFLENLGGVKTEDLSVWSFQTTCVPELKKFLATCNVSSHFVGGVKRQWTEEVKRKRNNKRVLYLLETFAKSLDLEPIIHEDDTNSTIEKSVLDIVCALEKVLHKRS